ncbi:16521_t:CDS:2 [Cetraspora pellucida]|uniref:16521_t:CDS:1 n=1 Tax=Cetraspora pellucida TaxID=1433469 RepID=A0A9N9BNC7_9GLOM|nr:16521_t:CDS:2 [Cetraspora pellucida]
MEYLGFANDIAPHRLIGVIVSSDESFKEFEIEPSDINKVLLMTLDEMREYLCQEGLALIGRQNTNFRNAFKNKIPLAREPECKLKDILIMTNEDIQDGSFSFYLEKDLKKPGFPEIVDRLHIDRGYKKNNDNIEPANRKAFRVRKPHMMDVIIEQKLEQHNSENPGRKLLIVKKGSIRLLQEDLEPTQEYINAVEIALTQPDNQRRREALNRIGEEYGFFWSKDIRLGGQLCVNDEQATDLTDLENLKLFEHWQIIEHNELLSLFNLLPQELISRIKEVIGMKLLHNDILNIAVPRNCSCVIQHIHRPQGISTFNGVKIFTSVVVMNNVKPYRNVFGIRVDYQNNENPYVVIHRIGPARHPFKLSIPWIHSALNVKNCWLGTCVLNPDDNPGYAFGHSRNVIGYHFRNAGNINTQICGYQYNLQDDRISNTLRFRINCAIITQTPNFRVVGPTGQQWRYRPCRLTYILANSRTYTGNRWNLLPGAIFASINYTDTDFNDHSLFLNIHRKYPITKSLNSIREDLNASVSYVAV